MNGLVSLSTRARSVDRENGMRSSARAVRSRLARMGDQGMDGHDAGDVQFTIPELTPSSLRRIGLLRMKPDSSDSGSGVADQHSIRNRAVVVSIPTAGNPVVLTPCRDAAGPEQITLDH